MGNETLAVAPGPTGLEPHPNRLRLIPGPPRLPPEWEPLSTWLAGGPDRECRVTGRRSVIWVDLFDSHLVIASVGKTDLASAVAEALRLASEAPAHNRKPVIGLTFGRWTVLGEGSGRGKRALCLCSCGTKRVVDAGALRRGHTSIDNDGDYEPGNCRWATTLEQANNTRATIRVVLGGVTMPMTDAARRASVKLPTFRQRIERGWDADAAATIPPLSPGQKMRVSP